MLTQNLDLDKIQSGAFPTAKFGGYAKIGDIIGSILPYIFGAAGIALLIYLIIGGLQIMTSRGDPKAMQSAQGKISNAIIGFIIVVFAYLLVVLIGKILGIQAFGNIFK
ncbi:MAG: hypothetical protein UU02_C0014G0006 [Candidatus Woesebacteria bacterium GW2011_GWA1_40_43]|uniref:Uncharacterized protein n=1 Tax=Candidatus Woesebacteria bacterium GW2011_GWA1_40_43 TaxID=1618553 RepID=A0A0G0SGS0_9BACT|nr:MAG: hypothetical protein UT88_C0021G0011 [Candidatus Woesebacteria bacterium GW2011_GWD2_40_19]KKR56366.1 MAG: hypothetical protein UT96_C0047G0004 [Candidatus Woesebacteria bacterium GW2011_GWC2_40_30]KKR64004.1 MAG: hypothetical protein UU02_C0014G0006 [Candidatus Woesebacteria bacterium GW2011_GWA1_40_43]HAU65145.1 hypothetical protein [Candidatus Woesebacteria bacterium]HCC08529.1 hypothetical protein [Candidatus Woesebacteria bacterium]